MQQESIDRIIKNKQLKLSTKQKLTHFLIVFFLLISPLLNAYWILEMYITSSYNGVRTAEELTTFNLPFILLAITFYFIQKKQLRFREVKVNYIKEEFEQALKLIADKYNWQIELNNKHVLRAYRPGHWLEGSKGEMITIIKGKDRLFLNSICNPNGKSSITSFGWNKKNIDTFIKKLKEVKKSKNIEELILTQEQDEKLENEKPLVKFAIRVVAYLFSIIFITVGVYIIFNVSDFWGKLLGLIMTTIASTYLYIDIKASIEKKKLNRSIIKRKIYPNQKVRTSWICLYRRGRTKSNN